MPEWLDWQHLSQQHRPVSEDGTTCITCGNALDTHWYPKTNPKPLLDEIAQIVDDEFNKDILK